MRCLRIDVKVEHFAVGKLEGGECKGGGLRVEDRFTIIQYNLPPSTVQKMICTCFTPRLSLPIYSRYQGVNADLGQHCGEAEQEKVAPVIFVNNFLRPKK